MALLHWSNVFFILISFNILYVIWCGNTLCCLTWGFLLIISKRIRLLSSFLITCILMRLDWHWKLKIKIGASEVIFVIFQWHHIVGIIKLIHLVLLIMMIVCTISMMDGHNLIHTDLLLQLLMHCAWPWWSTWWIVWRLATRLSRARAAWFRRLTWRRAWPGVQRLIVHHRLWEQLCF